MTDRPDPAPLPGLPEPAAGRRIVRCRACKHPLTDRDAILRGYGDDCAHKLGMRTVRGPGRFVVEQDELPGA